MTLEDIENTRKRLIFRSWHRGTKEMDLIMGSFADKHVPGFDEGQLNEYGRILELSDPDLYDWITKVKPVPENLNSPLLALFLQHKIDSPY